MVPNQTYKLLHNQGNHRQNTKQPINQEKIFSTNDTDKGLLNFQNIYIAHQLNNKKPNNPSKNGQKT